MSNIIQNIKIAAHKIAEDYLLLGKSTSVSTMKIIDDGDVSNEAILKRICEQVNQNIYLGLFNKPNAKKSDISFPLLDFNEMKEYFQKSENAMNDYKTSPSDLKGAFEVVMAADSDGINKQAALEGAAENNSENSKALKSLLSSVGAMKTAEARDAENAYDTILNETKQMIHSGDSIGDIAKIAACSIRDIGLNPMPLITMYDDIHQKIASDGTKVSTEITKVSSQKADVNSDVVKSINRYVISLEKYAAFDTMEKNIKKAISLIGC